MINDDINKIQDKRKSLEEMRFKQRELKSNLNQNINDIKNSMEDYKSLGILSKEQIELLISLDINKLDNISFDEFKEIMNDIQEIKNTVEENAKQLMDKIEELERSLN